MLNVVLVEDEKLVLLGMKMCIQDSEQDMKVAAAFSSAEAALEFFEHETADVLITDIRLTGISGLELVEKIKPRHPHMLIIILSCYEDFSYARRAYELGVDKYILKHELEEDKLGAMITELYTARIVKHAAKNNPIDDCDMEFGKNRFIKSNCSYSIGLITLRGEKEEPAVDNNDISFPMVLEIVQEILHRDALGECFLRHNSERFCIFNLDAGLSKEQAAGRIESFFKNISKSIKIYFNKYTFMTVSGTFSNLMKVKENFDEVKAASNYLFYESYPCILWAEKVRSKSKECPELVFNPQNIFSEQWMKDFEVNITRFFKSRKDELVDPEELKIQVVKYVTEFSSFMSKYYNVDINRVFPGEVRPNYIYINNFTNAEGLRDWLIQMTKEVEEYLRSNEKKETTISKIIEYVKQNYNKNLTLKEIAEKFHMNSVYVCQLFKKETGSNFVYYINRLRIEKAKGLLFSTDLTAEQIANQVGIRNSNYFFRLFKKVTGQTVNQYRKNLK